MIKRINISGFKSLTDVDIILTPLTVMVGNNAVGKSSVLQAIDFMCCSVKEDFEIWLERRKLSASDIRSNLIPSNVPSGPSFACELVLMDKDGVKRNYSWLISTRVFKERNQIIVTDEALECDGERLFTYTRSASSSGENEGISVNGIELHSSYMKIISRRTDIWKKIEPVWEFMNASNSFELLSPADMRLSSRGDGNAIGLSGRNLPSFISKMTDRQKSSYMKKVKEILGEHFDEVKTKTSAKAGWTKILTTESYSGKKLAVSSADISDGTLRILAFIAISEIQGPSCIMLMDEVENGINAGIAEKIIDLFKAMVEESGHQMMITTHSTIFLDYIAPEDITYIYRDDDGNTCAQQLFEKGSMKKLCENLYPGEILLNLGPTELIKRLLSEE